MTDPTLSTLAFIALVFGGVAVARILLRALLILNAVLHDPAILPPKAQAASWRPFDQPKAA